MSFLFFGCEEIPASDGGTGGGGGTLDGAGGAGNPFAEGESIEVPVGEGVRYVDLNTARLVGPADGWDLRFEGTSVFTNGGASGEGMGAAFGPLDVLTFLGDEIPQVPFMMEDVFGGAFTNWYDYDAAGGHVVYSRFHVYGVRRGDERYKVQVVGYYGEIEGAPVSAVYALRVADLSGGGSGQSVLREGIDGTAGGLSPTTDDPSACVRLADLSVIPLTPAQALGSTAWDICFRRSNVSVNGGQAGPGGVEAVNLTADSLLGETLEQVKARTAESELAAFESVTASDLEAPDLEWQSDGVRSAFTGTWLDTSVTPAVTERASYLVAAEDGSTPFLVLPESITFEGYTPTVVGLRFKKLKGSF